MPNDGYSRHFVAQEDVLNVWGKIESYFDLLRDCPIESPEALERWLIDYSELLACIEEIGTDRHVKMTCKTDDPECKAAFLDFIENIEPRCKPRCHELNIKYTECPYSRNLPEDRYRVLDVQFVASRFIHAVADRRCRGVLGFTDDDYSGSVSCPGETRSGDHRRTIRIRRRICIADGITGWFFVFESGQTHGHSDF